MKYFKMLTLLLLTVFCDKIIAQDSDKTEIRNLLDQKIEIRDIESFLESELHANQVQGISFALINDGKVIYYTTKGFADKENRKKVDAQTIFEGASLSKPLFAFFCMKAVEDKILDIDVPLYKYFPLDDLKHDGRNKKITARMILSHTSGLPNWRPKGGQLELKFDPGTSFAYSGEGYQYLANVLAHLYDTDYQGLEEIYQNKIAIPLNLRVTKYVQDEYNIKHKAKPYKSGIRMDGEPLLKEFGAAYSIHSEAIDFSHWLIGLMNEKGLSKENYDLLFQPNVTLPEDSQHRQQGVTHWTLGFAKAVLPFGTMYAHGGNNPGFTSLFAFNKEKKWGFVMFCNADQSNLPLKTILFLHSNQNK